MAIGFKLETDRKQEWKTACAAAAGAQPSPELREAVHRRVAAILKAAMPPIRVRPELGDLVIEATPHKLDRSPTR